MTVDDGNGGTATQVITVTVTGTNDAPTISGTATGGIKEDGPDTTVTGQLTQHDIDTNDTHTWSVNDGGKGEYGSFQIDQNGKWTYTLNNDDPKVQALKEGEGHRHHHRDRRRRPWRQDHADHHRHHHRHQRRGHHHPEQAGRRRRLGQEDDKLTTGGKLDVTDKDAGEASFKPQTDFKGDHGKFSIDANGNWKYELDNNDPKVQALGVGEKLTETFEVVTADGTKGTVTVTINGTNDAPVISGQASGEVTDGGNTSATGQLGKTDVDVNDTHTWSVSNDGKGKYGTFTVDQTGKWTYNLDPANTSVKELKTGESITETFTVYVDDGKGGKTPRPSPSRSTAPTTAPSSPRASRATTRAR